MIYPIFRQGYDLPPTLYSILNSIVNFNSEEKVKISDLYIKGRIVIFDFDYDLSKNVSRETFEKNILNHYLMRRINFETVTLFKIMLENKLNEILPKYNILFDKLNEFDIFKANVHTREYSETRNETNTNTTELTSNLTVQSDSNNETGFSDTPQSNIDDIKNNKYLTEFTNNNNISNSVNSGKTTNNGNGTNSSDINITETVTNTVDNEVDVLLKFQTDFNNIMTLIYKDLDCLFYGLI
nr:MAG TPA: Lower collar protein [Caudoviricetes sp.]